MNERIKELARKANMVEVEYHPGFPDIKYPANFEKFAELIVRECACRSYLEDSGNPEVEEALEFWRKDMLKHFGVEE